MSAKRHTGERLFLENMGLAGLFRQEPKRTGFAGVCRLNRVDRKVADGSAANEATPHSGILKRLRGVNLLRFNGTIGRSPDGPLWHNPVSGFCTVLDLKFPLISGAKIRNLITGMRLEYQTALGHLYRADCLELLRTIEDQSVSTFFADPPFNLKKDYGSKGSDNIPDADYLKWCESWLTEGVRVLVPGGALFLYNLPKWLMPLGTFLGSRDGMTFKHWIAVDKAHSLPIPNRLSTSHYGMLYFIKGDRPRVFNRDDVRIPIQVCRHCGRDVKDYGGRNALNPSY